MKKLMKSNDGATTSKEKKKATEMKKLIYDDGASTSKANQKPLKRKRDDDVAACFLKTRMSPKMLLAFISGNLSAQQVADIKAMGFGGLLNIKTDNVPGALAHWLVTRFDTLSSSFMKGQLHITDEDIHLATGIPLGPNEVKIASLSDKSEEFLELKRSWLKQFTNDPTKVDPTKIETKDILNLMISQREGGEEFKRNFIVFVVSTFLMGVKGSTASLRVLKCLMDISSVSSLNWCQFTRKQFIEAVESWRRSKNEYFGGPIMVFVFLYLDRVSYSYFSVPRVFPTLSRWTKKAITDRLKSEMVQGFGRGGIQARIVKGTVEEENFSFPSPSASSPHQEQKASVPSPMPHQQPPMPDKKPKPSNTPKNSKKRSSSSIKKLAECANFLASAYESFSEAIVEARNDWPSSKTVQQMAQMAEALSDCSYSSQRATDTVENDKVEEKGAFSNDKVEEKGAFSNKAGKEELDDNDKMKRFSDLGKQKFESEDDLWAALIKLETALGKRTVNETSNAMNFENKAKVPKAKSSSPILIDSESQEFEPFEPLHHIGKKAKASSPSRRSPRFTHPSPPKFTPPSFPMPSGFSPPSFRLLSSESQDDDHINEEAVNPLTVSPISSLPPEPEAVKRDRFPSEVFRSPFFERNTKVVGELNQSEKELVEFLSNELLDDSEILFKTDHHQLSRGDLKTLIWGDTVSKHVIHAWCHILNKAEKCRSRDSPSRLYLTSKFDANDIKKDFVGASLVFVPVLLPKPLTFCFNFLTSKLDVLNPMKLKSAPYENIIKDKRDFVISRLKEIMPHIGSVYMHTVEEFVPKSNLGNKTDSGIHMMRILETYKGSKRGYSTGLLESHQVKLFSLRASCQILTFDENRFKSNVQYDSRAFWFTVNHKELPNEPQPPYPYSDEDLFGFVFNNRRDANYLKEILVDTDWMEVTRGGLRSLKRRAWIMDIVIDMFGVLKTLNRDDILYLPTRVKYAKLGNKQSIWGPYLKSHYIPKNGNTIDKVFFALGNDKNDHWFTCVSDLKEKKNYILDSLMPKPKGQLAGTAYVDDILYNFENVFFEGNVQNGYERLRGISLFPTFYFDVPQQPNGFDCGLFVMKFLEATLTDRSLWTDKNHFRNLPSYRDSILLLLLKWEKNKNKVFS